ncbi:MAG: phenylacetic acid degradation operon negative regulatory protein [Actinomycetota bacterium]|jgi:phenylacetic acid degradation operon negative regulatory protein|nr:phenylacetic acid degradation operon negative regulatory protein [Actinomycetota bacterium]
MAVVGDTTVAIPTRVLVLGMAHENGTILNEELQPVAQACGLTPDQVRSCLRRLVSEGLFVRNGNGQQTKYEATEAGMAALGTAVERTRLAYVQDAAGRGWDRQWRLVAFAVPERERAARDAFRDHLINLGGAAVQGGLYVSPHPWHKDVKAEAERLGIEDAVTLATTDDLEVGGEHDPRKLAALLWPTTELANAYEKFNGRYQHIPDLLVEMRTKRQHLPDSAFLPAALAMTVAYDECAGADPLLPPELLPRPWPGRTARELLMSSRRLALALRKGQGRPALFRWFDEAIETIP